MTAGKAAFALGLSLSLAPLFAVSAPAAAETDEGGIQFAPDDEPAQPAAPAPAAKPDQAAGGPQVQMEANPEPELRLKAHSDDSAIFGHYRVRIMVAQPKFDDRLKYYDKLYGKPNIYPQIAADWFPFDWYATLGLSFRMGYYTASGHAAQSVPGTNGQPSGPPTTDAQVQPDLHSATTLTLIPLQACITAEGTPFKKKWVVLDGWAGVERLYYQEVREPAGASQQASGTQTPTTPTGQTAQSTDTTLTNVGWVNSVVVGFSANILLNPLDEVSAASLRGPMGLGSIYLSPFTEVVRASSKAGISFGRTTVGVAFTFESVD